MYINKRETPYNTQDHAWIDNEKNDRKIAFLYQSILHT